MRCSRSGRSQVCTRALFGKKQVAVVEPPPPPPKKGLFSFGKSATAVKEAPAKTGGKADEYTRRQSAFTQVTNALDFNQVRSKRDAELLYEARYGDRGADGKMSREQYQALRRKIGGTAKDYWKDWVEVKGKYTDKGYVARGGEAGLATNVPALPFLVLVTLGMFGVLAYVVVATGQ